MRGLLGAVHYDAKRLHCVGILVSKAKKCSIIQVRDGTRHRVPHKDLRRGRPGQFAARVA